MFVLKGEKQVFTYVSHKVGVTKDGEKYYIMNVLTKDERAKKSFMATKPELVDKLLSTKFVEFQDIILYLNDNDVYNKDYRRTFIERELVGIGANNTNSTAN